MVSILHSRGSEWRRWDLHVHTKDTLKNDQFTSGSFDDFCVVLFQKALEYNISAIGITDYFSIENYKRVKQFVQEIDSNTSFSPSDREKIKKIFILANVELRMIPVTDSGRLVNIHCLFNPDFEENLDNKFFNKVCHLSGTDRFPMNKRGITDLGASLDASLTTDQAKYEKGIDSFVVSHESLQKLFEEESVLRENTIVVVSNSSNDGASGFQHHYDFFEGQDVGSLDGLRKAIYCISDMIFSSNSNDIGYFLGMRIDDKETVRRKCGSLKPCIHGSDAHKEDKLFCPDNSKNCWIKADLTFEGLKQVVYEPSDRVAIQELLPEDKPTYQIIDKVKFIHPDSFTPDDILINQNLTAIIGGKSTGKSILLRNIAQAIDPVEVSNRLSEVQLSEYPETVSDFEVLWLDGQISKKNDTNLLGKKIIYIPQSYLNRLVDKREGKTAIDEIIKNVLEQNDDIKNTYDTLNDNKREIEKQLTITIENLFYKEKDILELTDNIKRIGDKIGIESEVVKLKQEVNDLKSTSGISMSEIEEYESLVEKQKLLELDQKTHEKDLILLEQIKSTARFVAISDSTGLSSNLQEYVEGVIGNLNEKYKAELVDKLNHKLLEVRENLKDVSKVLKANGLSLSPLITKVTESKALDEKIKKLNEQETKLKIITDEEKKLETLKLEYKELVQELVNKHEQFYGILFQVRADILRQNIITPEQELEFGVDITFQNRAFNKEFIDDICNLRYISAFEGKLLENYQRVDNNGFKSEIKKIITGILNDTLVLKSSYSKKEAITRLVKCWFDLDYKIKQNGDEISEMSPGKKSFVLLKLLIELDNSKCPILLDQPEDDLDNRSIYHDLVKFIRQKKTERQIIIATHNPNLVVGADAECVIVANQHGDGAENTVYTFEYVEGALENSFIEDTESRILYKQGIQKHVCDILEGGKTAFEQRKNKYNI